VTHPEEQGPTPTRLNYAEAPHHPWQLTFMVVVTLVCAGVLLLGMLMYGYRQAVGPASTQPATAVTTP